MHIIRKEKKKKLLRLHNKVYANFNKNIFNILQTFVKSEKFAEKLYIAILILLWKVLSLVELLT